MRAFLFREKILDAFFHFNFETKINKKKMCLINYLDF